MLGASLPAPATAEQASDYPSRNITYVVPFPAGGVADILARIYTPTLAETLGKPIVIENRPGASTSMATNSVMRSPPDGYTIMQVDMSYAVAPNVVIAGYDPVRDLTPVVQIARSTLVHMGVAVANLALFASVLILPGSALACFLAFRIRAWARRRMAHAGSSH